MSPYESRLDTENYRRIALIAGIDEESMDQLKGLLSGRPDSLSSELSAVGIHHLHFYVIRLDLGSFLFVYFETDCLDQEKAAQQLKGSSAWWHDVESCLRSHPRAVPADAPWQRAELINTIATNTARERMIGKPIGLMAGVHEESELWYRTLHQTNWPGVIDQMRRSQYQNWTTFLLDWGDALLLFTHFEYLGSDRTADDALMAADPVTQRWWKHTEPCLYSLVGDESSWVALDTY